MEICKIEEILERQFNNDKFKHRIFINGEWGIGKTYYVNEFKEKYKDKTIIYTSFFGKTKVEDIRKEIKHQIIRKKINNEKIEKTEEFFKENQLGKILKKIGQVGTAAIENKVGINLSLENIIDLIDVDEFDENMIIIFDDLERMSLNLEMIEILGLIEEFALNRNIVVIGHEEKIIDREKFTTFKEKIITREFKFEKPSKESYAGIVKKYDFENSDEILEIWNKFDCNNLRVFIKCLEFINEVKIHIKKSVEKELTDGLIKMIIAVVIEENTKKAINHYKKLENNSDKSKGFNLHSVMLKEYERYMTQYYSLNEDRDYKLIEKMQKFYYGELILENDLKEYFKKSSEESFESFFEIAFSKSAEEINLKIDKLKINLNEEIIIANNVTGLIKVFDSYINWCEKLNREIEFEKDMELLKNQFVKMYEPSNGGGSSFISDLYKNHEKSKKLDKIIGFFREEEEKRTKEIFKEEYKKYIVNKEWQLLAELISKPCNKIFIFDIFDELYEKLLDGIDLDYWRCLHSYMRLFGAEYKEKIEGKMKKLEKENSSNVMFLYRNKVFKENYLK